jgi:hypothetical protein
MTMGAAPDGFERVGLSDLDHLGMWRKAGTGFVDYWTESAPKVVRRERALGYGARKITTVRLRRARLTCAGKVERSG